MRIVIDLQAAQAESRSRGIGRYSLSLALAIARNRGEHEVLIALNGLFPDTIEPIRVAFKGLIPQENIRVWTAVAPVDSINTANSWRRQAAERVREAFLVSLMPDVVHVSSLFEGLADNAVTSIGLLSRAAPTCVTLYDLIPYIYRTPYLESSAIKSWYMDKIEHLRRADLWLAISESSRREGIEHLGLPDERSVNISTDADPHFQPLEIAAASRQALQDKYGLRRPFVMYTGGIDHRKNIEGLIRAFSILPPELRHAHQLAIVCSVQPDSKRLLQQLADRHGLSQDQVVLTGFVPEDDLIALYNLCTLFIFPSWHEGFGLPALEAMRCGAPVICSNTSSLPEVVGWEGALFDPHSDEAMAKAIARALSDPKFQAQLVQNGKTRAGKFSWDKSAQLALTAMERLHAERRETSSTSELAKRRPRLAYVSPLPPERTGIADYSAELLPELARYYEIDLIVSQKAVSNPWAKENCAIHTVEWLLENADQFDRILYHFGNSEYHQHMFDLLKAIPGVVVLHDFFLSGIAAHMELHGIAPGLWTQELYKAHGFAAVNERYHAMDTADVIWKYPCSLSVVQNSLGVITHSPNSLRLAEAWYGESKDWVVIPLMRKSHTAWSKDHSRKLLGFKSGDFLVCAFGFLAPTKLNHRLLEAWTKSRLALDGSCHLIFVGENHPGSYGEDLLARIRASEGRKNIRITGWTEMGAFRHYLAAADVAVQLRTLSRGETSAAVLDCMNYGLATIVNANGSMADLEDEAVLKLPDEFADEQLVDALEVLWQHEDRRGRVGEVARRVILRDHDPQICAEQYSKAIERFYESAAAGFPALPRAIAGIGSVPKDINLVELADAIAKSFPPRNNQRQLLVDVSALIQRESSSDIQRVVRSILKEWLSHPPAGYRVEPVYATVDQGYRYARRFTLDFIDCPCGILQDEPVEYGAGHVFIGLDMQPQIVAAQRTFYQTLRRQGVRVQFVVYDLSRVLMPDAFALGAAGEFRQWLEVVAEGDGAICVSKTVADQLAAWIKANGRERQRLFKIDWFHLGADVYNSNPTQGLPVEADAVLDHLWSGSSFLMVGPLDFPKGYAQVLEAFEGLWQQGQNVNLVIVGKQGSSVKDLVERIHAHSELNKRLFWLESVSDEYLEKIYAVSTCLIAASYGESFGLSLIEAAQHKLPVIARDIPVFREVAGEHAYYFKADSGVELTQSLKDWLGLYGEKRIPSSSGMSLLTWRQCAESLAKLCINA